MRRSVVKLSLILAGLVGSAAYGWILMDWLQDMKTGNFDSDPLEVVNEAVVIVAYCYLAYHFIKSSIKQGSHLQNHPSDVPVDDRLPNRGNPDHWVKPDRAVTNTTQWISADPDPTQPHRV
ncbi:hypothetical protein GO730_31330 [Spirosoma sp. HMF3257]|uniref:Uncharacterized protein n=1 Tax=Spirosoma telluris TaxID=2183553 RepID=A0A327NQ77_9BACT|nr:hypothetical protein [Spirosoma telluris]RAI77520.1 hypothetical protein HMF3257_31230 [Spirosoma telluris]